MGKQYTLKKKRQMKAFVMLNIYDSNIGMYKYTYYSYIGKL